MTSQSKERRFGAATTAAEVAEGIDLTGKVAIVTGASGGIGAETARVLAERGAHVTITARDAAKGRKVCEEIRGAVGEDRVDVMELRLDVAESVRSFARDFRSRHPALHILVGNAGVMACPLTRTAEGHELQFATNHLGHFLLAGLLAPALLAGAPARVVSLSSRGHRFSPVVFDDIHFERRPYDKWAAYGQSKTANVLFAVALDRRLGAAGVHANALHPGTIMTDLSRHMTSDDLHDLQSRMPGGKGFQFKSIEAGAATSVWAATAPELEGKGGLYLEDCHVSRPRRGSDDEEGYEAHAVDPDAAERLWQVSEEMVGERFDFGR
jgi:NAD(P)-dependent dehydrogenase (short-subunit alcohol dehydrogenase family)